MRKNIRIISDTDALRHKIAEFSQPIGLEQMDCLTESQYSKNSLLAMVKDWNLYVEFCVEKGVNPLPASATAVRQYVERLATKRKYATVRRNTVTIGLLHRILSQTDPTTNSQVRNVLTQIRLNKHGDAKQATPLQLHHIKRLEKLCSKSPTIQEIRDIAICYVMFECAMKRSELKSLVFSNIAVNGADTYIQLGDSNYRLSEQACRALTQWNDLVAVQEGCVFRAIDKHGNIASNPMDDSSIYRVMRRVGDKLGVSALSGQSLRVGAVKELAKQGLKPRDIQLFGRWLSPAMPYQYLGNVEQAETEKIVFKTIKPWR
ncbi:tyrosine-type recombinase/integrase [Vibrio marisflavi]|uniref:Tyrosine recombinase XerC n=1 Tax=Vibrio marisflavi CECT 7928 TaxID=634439 RepID=A0ABM9A1F0_9VIBR|nr:tyrosine-type recombinase/integrase [Vibrio marisflavi]CAH0536863.1 Tyrosine recombinase XerC [Vibrio marisflavi CECT 7928]